LLHLLFQGRGVLLHALERRLVVLRLAELEQLVGVGEAAVDPGDRFDGGLQILLFAPQLLGALRVGPDLRVLEQLVDLYEALFLRVEVKGTSSAPRTSAAGL
jgi:hypothetical protein